MRKLFLALSFSAISFSVTPAFANLIQFDFSGVIFFARDDQGLFKGQDVLQDPVSASFLVDTSTGTLFTSPDAKALYDFSGVGTAPIVSAFGAGPINNNLGTNYSLGHTTGDYAIYIPPQTDTLDLVYATGPGASMADFLRVSLTAPLPSPFIFDQNFKLVGSDLGELSLAWNGIPCGSDICGNGTNTIVEAHITSASAVDLSVQSVPEASSLWIFAAGLAGLGLWGTWARHRGTVPALKTT